MSSRFTPARQLIRDRQRAEAKARGPAQRPLAATLLAADGQTETIAYLDAVASTNTVAVAHPYVGPSSWLRVLPETGSTGMMLRRGDVPYPILVGYSNEGAAPTRIEQMTRKADLYRPLAEGEFDFLSSGRSYMHGSSRGTLALRGGSVHVTLSHDQLELQARAPTHKVEALGYLDGALTNSTRFGVVKRFQQPTGSGPTASGASTIYDRPIRVLHGGALTWAKEHTTVLSTKASPTLLLDLRQGHVVADDGTEPTHPETGKRLRVQGQWGTTTEGDVVRLFIDDAGNVTFRLPATSEQGMLLDVMGGRFEAKAARMMRLSTQDVFRVQSAGTLDLQGNADVKVGAATTVTITSPLTRVGSSNAALPVALAGTSLSLARAIQALIATATYLNGGVPTLITLNPAAVAAYNAAVSGGIGSTKLFTDG